MFRVSSEPSARIRPRHTGLHGGPARKPEGARLVAGSNPVGSIQRREKCATLSGRNRFGGTDSPSRTRSTGLRGFDVAYAADPGSKPGRSMQRTPAARCARPIHWPREEVRGTRQSRRAAASVGRIPRDPPSREVTCVRHSQPWVRSPVQRGSATGPMVESSVEATKRSGR